MNSRWSHQVRTSCLVAGMLLVCSVSVNGQVSEEKTTHSAEHLFQTWFDDGALRFEFLQVGDTKSSVVTLQEMYSEPYWAENAAMLNPAFRYGRIQARVFDDRTGTLICTRRFDTMFAEYKTTDPARNGMKRAYEMTVRIPTPKATFRLVVQERDSRDKYQTLFESKIDPTDYHIRRDAVSSTDVIFAIDEPGDSKTHVDIAFLSEGYTDEELPKFRADVRKMTEFLVSQSPYNDLKDRINVRGVFRPSSQSGTDQPRQNDYRSTVLNSSFNIFDLDRYLLVEDNHAMHRMAAQVPYDTIVVLVNTERYGGGGIGLDYCVCTAGHANSPLTFLHEFGHSFASLADEYIGNVAYNDIYPEGLEPVEPNITRQLDRDQIKWKAFLTPDVALPTPLAERSAAKAMQIVGAFEGGGYLKEGMYRPEQACWMGSLDPDEGFCVVCSEAIRQMIYLQTGQLSAPKATTSEN